MPGRLLLLLSLVAALAAGEVNLTAAIPWDDQDGFTPVLIRAESMTRSQDVHVEAQIGNGRASTELRIEPGRAITRTLLLPTHARYGSAHVTWVGDTGAATIAQTPEIAYRECSLILLDPAETLPLPRLELMARHMVGGYSPRAAQRLAADMLPDRWQGWPCWLTLMTTPAGEARLTQAQREAIAIWTRSGGALFVTAAESQAAWSHLGVETTLCPLDELTGLLPKEDPTKPDPARGDETPRLAPGHFLSLLETRLAASHQDHRNELHPVPGTDQVPATWFIVLALAFVLVAGPLNLLWVRRRGKPWLLLVTTPLLSIGTCLLIGIIALLSDGLSPRRSVVQIAVLDPAQQHCIVFTGVTLFCSIAPGRFDLDSEDRLLLLEPGSYHGGGRRDEADLGITWSSDITVATNPQAGPEWIPSRINRQLAWTQSRPERRRLVMVRAGTDWRVANGLGTAITELQWRAPDRSLWQCGRLEAGAEAVLAPCKTGRTDLPLSRLGPDAGLACAGTATASGVFICRLAAPLHPIPGPKAEDAEPIQSWVVGRPELR